MKDLLEHEIFAEVIGEEVNRDHLLQIAVPGIGSNASYSDCREYIVRHAAYANNEQFCRSFKLTPALKQHWEKDKIDFKVYIYVKDSQIVGGHISKYKKFKSGRHSIGYETDPTQQEIRIAERILNFIKS